jgi:hypothetical protein
VGEDQVRAGHHYQELFELFIIIKYLKNYLRRMAKPTILPRDIQSSFIGFYNTDFAVFHGDIIFGVSAES